jgi:5-methylcytosine-specific restriction endonuclease McrA
MQDYAASFYKSTRWQECRAAYVAYRGGLCEKCLAKGLYVPGVIVHHKTHITPENIANPAITLNFDNLMLLCRECHGEEHQRIKRRYKINDEGRVMTKIDE